MEAALPVVFSDGEQEASIGNIFVFPDLQFKDLQTILSERIGLSPHQFLVFLADRERPGARIPITGKTNFLAISRERERSWIFLVVLKRTRRGRRRRELEDDNMLNRRFDPPPANLMLLKRDGDNIAVNGSGSTGLDLGQVGYEKRLRELRMEKERYLMSMRLMLDMGSGTEEGSGVLCEECLRGRDAGFHWCVNDCVTFGFRSRAGPIARPAKRPGGDG